MKKQVNQNEIELQIKKGEDSMVEDEHNNNSINNNNNDEVLDYELDDIMQGSQREAIKSYKNKDMLTQEQGVNLGADDKDYEIDHQKLLDFIEINHPMNQKNESYSCGEIIKETPTGGYSCCCSTTASTEFDQFGLGINLYFRFLKTTAKYFLLFSLTTLPMLIVGYCNFLQTETQSNLDTFLYSLTIGSLTQYNSVCSLYKKLKDTSGLTASQQVMTVQCSNGGILDIDSQLIQNNIHYNYIFGVVTDQYDQSATTCKQIYRPNVEQVVTTQALRNYINTNCNNQQSCTIPMDDTNRQLFIDLSRSKLGQQALLSKAVFMYFFCKNAQINIGGGKTISVANISFFIGLIDGIIILTYFYMMSNLSISGSKATINILGNSLSPSLLTIEVRNLPKDKSREVLIGNLWDYYENYYNTVYNQKMKALNPPKIKQNQDKVDNVDNVDNVEKVDNDYIDEDEEEDQGYQEKQFKIVDIQISQGSKVMAYEIEYNKLIYKKIDIIKSYRRDYDKEKKLPDMCYLQDIRMHFSSEIEEKDKKKVEKIIQELGKLEEQIQKQQKKMIDLKMDKVQIIAAWITFQTMEQRNLIHDDLQFSFCQRLAFNLCNCLCFKDYFNKWSGSFKGRLLKVDNAPDPSNINWENLNYNKFEKSIRRFISLIITIILLVITFLSLIYFNAQKQIIINDNPTVDCTLKQFANVTVQQVISEKQSNNSMGYTYCYCSNMTRLEEQFTIVQNNVSTQQQLCKMLQAQQATIKGISIGMVVIIVIINTVMQFLFQQLARFEAYDSLTEEYASKVSKIFIAQFINTGLVVLLINMRIGNQGDLGDKIQDRIKGNYTDFNNQWYQQIGITIAFTMLVNTVSVPIGLAVSALIAKILRCFDRGCSSDTSKTRQNKQSDYQQMYLGAEFIIEIRYAQILTMFFISFTYSLGIPTLYLTSAIQLYVTYWIDKICLLNFCKKPQNLDDSLQIMTQKFLYVFIIFHILISVWILGTPDNFYENPQYALIGKIPYLQNIDYKDIQQNYLLTFFSRLGRPQNNIPFALCILLIVGLIIKTFLLGPFTQCITLIINAFRKQTGFNEGKYKNPYLQIDYYKFLKKMEVEKDIQLIKLDLKEADINMDQKYKEKIRRRKKDLKDYQEIIQKDPETYNKNSKFISTFSYDIRHNNIYSQMLGVDEKLKLEIESEYNSLQNDLTKQSQLDNNNNESTSFLLKK